MTPSDQDPHADKDNLPAGAAEGGAANGGAAGAAQPTAPPGSPSADAGAVPDAQRNEALQKALDDSIGAAGAGPAV